MRIACLEGKPVAITADGAYELSSLLPGGGDRCTGAGDMVALIREWPLVEAAMKAEGVRSLPVVDTASAAWEAPVPRPGKIVGAPVNYRAHQQEMRHEPAVEDHSLFLKASSSVIGPFANIVLPFSDRRIDQEAELAVVVGRRGRSLAVHEALDYVFGYTCLIDATLRGPGERSARKSFDTFCPMGPWMVTAAEVGDPGSLRLRCWVNGRLRQDASTSELVFSVPQLISHASQMMTLEPGDVIATGTPGGAGPLRPGDHVVVEIDRIGRLEVGVEAAPTEGADGGADAPL